MRLSAWLRWRSDDRVAVASLVAYYLLPYLLVQVGNVGLVRRGRGTSTDVALTFDDGPDPASTPLVLDALRQAGVKATFFVVGVRPTLFRPPHGAYTLVAILALRLEGLRGVHWTVMGNDWVEFMTPRRIVERIMTFLKPGGVIVLHDAGPGAKLCVLTLPLLLDALHQRGLRAGPVRDLPNARPERPRDLLPRLSKLLRGLPR